MARRVFTSFHFQRDIWRANQVRNSWLTKGGQANAFYDASLWEEAQTKGVRAIENLIDAGLDGTSVTAVLIGSETADRRFVNYEIEQSHNRGKGMLGIYIHYLKDQHGHTCHPGANPFSNFTIEQHGRLVSLATIYPTYDWVLDDGYNNFPTWVEQAANAAGR